MSAALQLRELRLTGFKSYEDAVLPLSPLTVLIGRNGSGKSNALDALEVLARLAQGDDVRDALEGGRRDVSPVRGGIEGCAPSGSSEFTLGVTVGDAATDEEATFWCTLDVTIQVSPEVRVIHERFEAWLPDSERWAVVLETEPDPDLALSDILAAVHSPRRGRNPSMTFRSIRLATAQLPLRLSGDEPADSEILHVAEAALAAMGGVFHLDPVPHLMRGYVPVQDAVLRRTGDNLSAAVARMQRENKDTFQQLVEIIRELPEHDVRGIKIGKGGFGDVMLALQERRGRRSVTIPARQMSDGMLRMLAIATALLTGGRGVAMEPSASTSNIPSLCLVLEELENGLHPSQAARVLEVVRNASTSGAMQVVMTTHSPAVLNALRGEDHPGVLVCQRDRTSGTSQARRLTDLPDYLRFMARGRLGELVTDGLLPDTATSASDVAQARSRALNDLLGIG